MEKWIKITESNFLLFQSNDDLITFISILRLCDADGMLDSTMSKLSATAKLDNEKVRLSLNNLFRQGLVSGNSDGDVLLCKLNIDKKKWIGGDRPAAVRQEQQLSPAEQQFRDRLKQKFDRIAGMSRPLLLSEYNEINKIYSREQILEVMVQMQNYAKLLKNYTSAKLTLLNWLKRRYG